MKYFVGIESFTTETIFDASLFVHIRKRIDTEMINSITCSLIDAERESRKNKMDDTDLHSKDKQSDNEDFPIVDEEGNIHQGTIKIDATCCDVEIKYPIDLDLLDDARVICIRFFTQNTPTIFSLFANEGYSLIVTFSIYCLNNLTLVNVLLIITDVAA